ncbi:hypothetical protein EIN_289520 [Entamoeba invadens IP1]|uniref:Leucine rich repeat containing protein BspA family protein n=1 Tax=Entamoeba invadens IP1 TaxID=370355 RepID=L7FKI5_ENTIV|nr:hypothetical protein EIN_289520 [Entamoeba invadens IP1]ELP86680.1 hypothetical protein EIN_289520 [Entamoeba invadens IP1]|eukprot:XP_004186026.1 hypothetical protein EIN_289520 [Entamoeba invadens IP1]
MAKLDPFHIMIVSQYFTGISDFKNLENVHQKYKGNMLKFHFNPIPLTPEILPLFPNIETLNVWSLPAEFFNFYDLVEDSLHSDYKKKKTQKNTRKSRKSLTREFVHLNIWYEVSYSRSLITENGKISYKNICLFDFERRMNYNTIPQNVKSLGDKCFAFEKTLSEIIIPDSVTRLNYECFTSCTNLTKVVLPKTLKEIQGLCFDGCKSLEEIEIPETVETIGYNAFSGCEKISKVEMPGSVKVLREWTFAGCVSLREVVLHDGINSINYDVFARCDLNTVVVPKSVTQLDSTAFDKNVVIIRN